MAATRESYAITDLEEMTGVNARNIRYYISLGLLPPARGRGPSATYDARHLARLKLVQALKSQHLPLKDIQSRLAELSDRQIAALADVRPVQKGDRWRRVQLHPDIELHYRERSDGGLDPIEETVALIADLARNVIERLDHPSER